MAEGEEGRHGGRLEAVEGVVTSMAEGEAWRKGINTSERRGGKNERQINIARKGRKQVGRNREEVSVAREGKNQAGRSYDEGGEESGREEEVEGNVPGEGKLRHAYDGGEGGCWQ